MGVYVFGTFDVNIWGGFRVAPLCFKECEKIVNNAILGCIITIFAYCKTIIGIINE